MNSRMMKEDVGGMTVLFDCEDIGVGTDELESLGFELNDSDYRYMTTLVVLGSSVEEIRASIDRLNEFHQEEYGEPLPEFTLIVEAGGSYAQVFAYNWKEAWAAVSGLADTFERTRRYAQQEGEGGPGSVESWIEEYGPDVSYDLGGIDLGGWTFGASYQSDSYVLGPVYLNSLEDYDRCQQALSQKVPSLEEIFAANLEDKDLAHMMAFALSDIEAEEYTYGNGMWNEMYNYGFFPHDGYWADGTAVDGDEDDEDGPFGFGRDDEEEYDDEDDEPPVSEELDRLRQLVNH